MKMSILAAGCLALVSQVSHADLLTSTPGTAQVQGVTIPTSTQLLLPGATSAIPLKTFSYGLRKKIVGGILNVDVYVMTVMVNDPTQIRHDTAANALADIENQQQVVFDMHMLRGVSNSQVVGAFRDSLNANVADMSNNADIQNFLTQVGTTGDGANGQDMKIVIDRTGNQVIFQNTSGQQIVIPSAPADLMTALYAVWFGKMSDSGLSNLLKAMLASASAPAAN